MDVTKRKFVYDVSGVNFVSFEDPDESLENTDTIGEDDLIRPVIRIHSVIFVENYITPENNYIIINKIIKMKIVIVTTVTNIFQLK